jgi:hypothetical protein
MITSCVATDYDIFSSRNCLFEVWPILTFSPVMYVPKKIVVDYACDGRCVSIQAVDLADLICE